MRCAARNSWQALAFLLPAGVASCAMQTQSVTHSEVATRLRAAVLNRLPQLAGHNWTPLTGGRINQLWRVGDAVVKWYNPVGASPLFPNDQGAEALALRKLHPAGFAPELLADAPGWLAYRFIRTGAACARPSLVAETLVRLHRHSGAGLNFRRLQGGSAELRARSLEIAGLCAGGLPTPPRVPELPPSGPCVIHGDAVPGNIIHSDQGIKLIDWQCPALGDPCEDMAAWLSPAMQWLYTGHVPDPADAAEFLAVFPPETRDRYTALAPLFHWRMAAHCLWRAEQGSSDYRHALSLELGALAH